MSSCPYCFGSAPTVVYANAVLCDCGCIYRPARHDWNPYTAGSFAPNLDTHRLMMECLVSRLPERRWDGVLEIGAATGLLAERFSVRFGQTAYHAIEPAADMANRLRRLPIRVTERTFDEVDPDGPVDLVLCCNVDYLFADINRCMDTIHATLGPDGLLVIQRNVFVEQRGYVGQPKPFASLAEMFAPNPLIANWFMLAQYREFLGRRFTIEHAVTDSTGVGFVNTYFCRRAERRDPAPLVLHHEALARLDSLGYRSLAAAS